MPFHPFTSVAVALLLLAAAPTFSPDPAPTVASVEIQTNDSETAAQLDGRLPPDLHFENRMGTAEVARLPYQLKVGDAGAVTSYRTGDVAYWEAEQSLVVFLSDGAGVPKNGVVMLGRVASNLKTFAECVSDCAIRLTTKDNAP